MWKRLLCSFLFGSLLVSAATALRCFQDSPEGIRATEPTDCTGYNDWCYIFDGGQHNCVSVDDWRKAVCQREVECFCDQDGCNMNMETALRTMGKLPSPVKEGREPILENSAKNFTQLLEKIISKKTKEETATIDNEEIFKKTQEIGESPLAAGNITLKIFTAAHVLLALFYLR